MSDQPDKSFSFHGPQRFEDLPPETQQALDHMIGKAFDMVEELQAAAIEIIEANTMLRRGFIPDDEEYFEYKEREIVRLVHMHMNGEIDLLA